MYGYDVTEIRKGVYILYETERTVSMYLVCGEKRAALIDSGCAGGELDKLVKSLTDLPVDVLLTHGHYDHYLGAFLFGKAYLDERDRFIADVYADEIALAELGEAREKELLKLGPPEYLPMKKSFDLGGRTLSTIDISGHTPGSVGYILEEERILFPGDAIIYNVWMQLDESLTIEDYARTLARLEHDGVLDRFDIMCNGHAPAPVDKSFFHCAKRLVDSVIATQPGEWLEQPFPGYLADSGEAQMMYMKEKVHGTSHPKKAAWL